MIFFPAIDLKQGQCVRLLRGEINKSTVYSDDPAGQARAFAVQGCDWLHIVDLDGAFSGRPENRQAVEAILKAVPVPIQLGGGIRDMATVEFWLAKGVARVILGTVAVKNPDLVRAACRRFPGRIAVGIDARDGMAATEGWAESSTVAAVDLAGRFADAGVAAIIYTDIARDGALAGPNVAATVAIAESTPVPVIASGGVSSLDDLRALKRASARAKRPLAGVISGRALYDGRLDVAAAVAALKEAA